MGMCSGKYTHCSHRGPERHSLTCFGQKVKLIQGLRDENESAELLVFESEVMSDDKQVIRRNAKSEEEVFGYSVISQEARGGSRQSTPKSVDRKFPIAAGDAMQASFPDINFDSRTGQKVAFLPVQPAITELDMYIVTWNMNGRALVKSIAKLLDVDGERHDLYIIGLQEAHNSVAESAISEALGEKYSFVSAASMQSLQLFIIARKAIRPFLSRPLVDKISTGGLGGLAGRQKGAVAITFRFKEAVLLFVACHLAPHESNVGERNAQYHRISQAVFNRQAPVVGPPGGVFSGCSAKNGLISVDTPILDTEQYPGFNSRFVDKADVVVWMGDLNYRVEMDRSRVAFFVRHKLEEVLWPSDQLTRALQKRQAFIGYQEGPLSFRPTYKYDVGTDNYDTSSKERVPSWTDRILYKEVNPGRLKVKLNSYNCINSIKSSDHRPVKALMTVRLCSKQEKVKYVY